MTPGQQRQAVKLIRKLCSYYDNGNCLYLSRGEEVTCPQSISYSICCKMFRHVLLEDKEGQALKAEIFKDDTLKRCSVCGKTFASSSNNAKYCGECARIVSHRQKAAHARKRRLGVEK
jgi:hypothetical protein